MFGFPEKTHTHTQLVKVFLINTVVGVEHVLPKRSYQPVLSGMVSSQCGKVLHDDEDDDDDDANRFWEEMGYEDLQLKGTTAVVK